MGQSGLRKAAGKRLAVLLALSGGVVLLALVCLFVGSSGMTVGECLAALVGKGTAAQQRILWNIRLPRVLAAMIAGAGLSVSGLMMQTTLNNAGRDAFIQLFRTPPEQRNPQAISRSQAASSSSLG